MVDFVKGDSFASGDQYWKHEPNYASVINPAYTGGVGGGKLTLPANVGHKFESEVVICVSTELTCQSGNEF